MLLLPKSDHHAVGKLASDLGVLAREEGIPVREYSTSNRVRYFGMALGSTVKRCGFIVLYPHFMNATTRRLSKFAYWMFWTAWGSRLRMRCIYLDDLASEQQAGLVSPQDLKVLRTQEDHVLRRADCIVLQSRAMVDGRVYKSGAEIVETGPLPYLLPKSSVRPISTRFGTRLLWAGNLERRYVGDWPELLVLSPGRHSLELIGNGGEWLNGMPRLRVHQPLPREQLEALARDCSFGIVHYSPEMTPYFSRTFGAKLSFYLAVGLPCLVQADVELAARFVRRKECGLTYDRVEEIPDLISNLTVTEWLSLQRNAVEAGTSIRTGSEVRKALRRVVTID